MKIDLGEVKFCDDCLLLCDAYEPFNGEFCKADVKSFDCNRWVFSHEQDGSTKRKIIRPDECIERYGE